MRGELKESASFWWSCGWVVKCLKYADLFSHQRRSPTVGTPSDKKKKGQSVSQSGHYILINTNIKVPSVSFNLFLFSLYLKTAEHESECTASQAHFGEGLDILGTEL